MLPVAILPAAGLLLAIGTAFQEVKHYSNIFHLLKWSNSKILLTGAGGIIF